MHRQRRLYLPSVRGFDPSPRLIPECLYFEKNIIYHNFKSIKKFKDGAYYRWLDCLNGLDKVWLREDDKIFKIIEEKGRW